jgi:hypothetical protein
VYETHEPLMVVAKYLIDGWEQLRNEMGAESKFDMDRILNREFRGPGFFFYSLCILCSRELSMMFLSIVANCLHGILNGFEKNAQ